MADSEISTSLSSVTRRRLLTGTMAGAAVLPLHHGGAAAAGALARNAAFDPALSLWHEWKAAYLKTAELCRIQQELETRLAETIGFPQAEIHLPGEGATISVSWHGDIEELFGDDPDFADVRDRAEDDLAAHQERWDEEDRRIGYSTAKRKELAAADHEQRLVEMLMATPATTLAGVAGKLDAILREGESSENCFEGPWPQIRSALADLIRISKALHPAMVMPGSDRNEPYPRQCREDVCLSVMMYQRGDRAP